MQKRFEQCICSRKGVSVCDWKFKDNHSFTCILSCCKSCSFCRRVTAKERCKSRSSKLNKVCERCFLCKSIEFCTKCHQCPTCCTKSTCRGQITPVLGKLGNLRGQSQSVNSPQGRVHITLPVRPNLTRTPTITSCYVNLHRNSYLLEALHQLLDKNAVELVQNPQSVGFYNRLFLVPKPKNRWRPILDLSKLKTFLKTQSFKMETLETIRTSLQTGEWVTSIDFKDAYFHIPINNQSRKYIRFHIQGETYQFKALPFGLSTAPMEFTVVAKEVKVLAMKQGIRTHQYLDDWLVRA